MLLKRFDEVMNYDYTINKKALTNTQNQLLKSYSNPRYWINDLKPKERDRHKKRLKQIIENHSQNLHQQLMQEIIKKCVIINRLSEKAKCVIINSSSISVNITQKHLQKPVNKCPITGLPLTHEKEDAKYIRTATLNYLHENDKKKFAEVCSLLLNNSKGGRPKYEKGIIY